MGAESDRSVENLWRAVRASLKGMMSAVARVPVGGHSKKIVAPRVGLYYNSIVIIRMEILVNIRTLLQHHHFRLLHGVVSTQHSSHVHALPWSLTLSTTKYCVHSNP